MKIIKNLFKKTTEKYYINTRLLFKKPRKDLFQPFVFTKCFL